MIKAPGTAPYHHPLAMGHGMYQAAFDAQRRFQKAGLATWGSIGVRRAKI